MKNLNEQVVVITGASSGIGRATAERFAEEGAMLALLARDEYALEEVASSCRAKGGKPLVIPTDVANEIAVQTALVRILDAFGHIDVWFNNAGVGVFGPMEEIPSDVYRQVIETNLFGYIHGARAVLPLFKRQGQGVLINNASVAGKIGVPFASAYVASKFAIVGLSQSLREELQDFPEVHVCTILPAAIDTPFFQHAGNFSGKKINAPGRVHEPEQVAEKVLDLVHHPKPEVAVGNAPTGRAVLHEIFPRAVERVLGKILARQHFKPEAAAPKEGLTIHTEREDKLIHGGWKNQTSDKVCFSAVAGGVAGTAGLAYMAWKRFRAA